MYQWEPGFTSFSILILIILLLVSNLLVILQKSLYIPLVQESLYLLHILQLLDLEAYPSCCKLSARDL